MNTTTLLETDILSQLEFENEEEQMQFLAELSEILFSRIIDRVSSILTDDEQQNLIALMDKDADIVKVLETLETAIPHFYTLAGQEVVDLKYEVLEHAGINPETNAPELINQTA